jgi:hypothetical protein
MGSEMVVHSVTDLKDMAMAMHASKLYKFEKPEQYLALMFKAQAEGRHPATVVEDYHFFNGRAGLKAEAALARHLESDGTVEWITTTATCCEAKFSHPRGGTYTSKFTIEDAKKAGLTGKDVWQKYSEDMLRARVIARGCRAVNPGVFRGMRVLEELQDDPVETTSHAPAPAPAAKAIPRASEVADEAEVVAEPEPTPAPEPEAVTPAAAPAPTPAHPADSMYIKEVPSQVKEKEDPATKKMRYGLFFSTGLIGTFSKAAADAAQIAIDSNKPMEAAFKVVPAGVAGKTKNELVWFNGVVVEG